MGSAHLDILIGHPDVVRICLQVFGCGHDRKLNCPLIAKSLVGPFADRPNLLDGRNSIVRDQYLADVNDGVSSQFLA